MNDTKQSNTGSNTCQALESEGEVLNPLNAEPIDWDKLVREAKASCGEGDDWLDEYLPIYRADEDQPGYSIYGPGGIEPDAQTSAGRPRR